MTMVMMQAKGACCAGIDIHDACTVSARLGIPHYVLDYESRFHDQVIQDFADSYLRGETPIPCVRCNQTVKFTDLLATARDLGADCLATGHYVQRFETDRGVSLVRGADPAKDQSYFLFATTPEQLAYLRFPLGGMSKEETRDLARRYGLAVSEKPDSQDICFVPNGRYGDVVRRLRPGAVDAGEIRHLDGTVLGRHNGVIDYTIGQRRGLGIGGRRALMSQTGRYMLSELMPIAIQCWPASGTGLPRCTFMMLTGSMDRQRMALKYWHDCAIRRRQQTRTFIVPPRGGNADHFS